MALACAMREALATPGRTAALITPDVTVARRVGAELARWGIEVEASAGRPLGETQAGVLARLALAAARDFAPSPLAALFGDRLTRLGRTAQAFDEAARALDIGVFRIFLPPAGLADQAAALAAGRSAQRASHAHPARRRLTAADWSAAEALLADAAAALAPLACAWARCAARRFRRRPSRRSRRAGGRGLRLARRERRRSAGGAAGRLGGGGRPRLPLLPRRLRGAVRRGAGGRARAAVARFPPASADPRPARSAAAHFRPRAARRTRRDRLAAGRRDRRLPQSLDARRARPVAAGTAHRPDRARFRRRARRWRSHRQPRAQTRRRADRRFALSPAHRRRRRRDRIRRR